MERSVERYLIEWKHSKDRLPLLIRGARQVGKTYIIEAFGKKHFENSLVINFEQQREYLACFNTLYPKQILNLIYTLSGKSITPGKTLLFLDEIQECPNAILALRYFYEQMPELHIIAAGSLLEFVIRNPNFRMPVGRIQSCYIKPLSFKEYLMANKKNQLIEYIEKITLRDPAEPVIHNQLLTLIKEYLVLGGMPAVIQQYLNTGSFEQSQIRQNVILETYRGDFGKYAKHTDIKYLQTLYDKTPGLVGKHCKYADFDPHMQSRYLKRAINDLKDAGVIYTIHSSKANALPLISTINEKKFKLLFLDVGLVNNVTKLSAQVLMSDDILLIHQGMLAEQFVAQELLAYAPCYREENLFFWERDKKTSNAEIDYIIAIDSLILPIEVKAGTTGRLRSLQLFLEEKNSSLGIRISQKELSYHNKVLSIPFYMISEISRLVSALQ
ncbi:MAG: ATP-binding protein [Candidatus Berkiella sp.]